MATKKLYEKPTKDLIDLVNRNTKPIEGKAIKPKAQPKPKTK